MKSKQVAKTGGKAAILQSSYIPWKGYFDLINDVDHFVLFDDVQFTRRDWRNRNKVKTQHGLQWLTVPVQVKGKFDQRIRDTTVSEPAWAQQHWQSILHSYGRSPYFNTYRPLLQDLYAQAESMSRLSDINHLFITAFCKVLGIQTKLHWSSDFALADEKSERLASICQQLNVSEYVSGPAAKAYLNEAAFSERDVAVSWYSYDGYPEYEQVYPPFEHGVSIVDLLVHTGTDARSYMRSFR